MRKLFAIFLSIPILAACQKTGGASAAQVKKLKAPAGDTTAIVAGVDTFGITKGMVNQLIQPALPQLAQQAQMTGQDIDQLLAQVRQQATTTILLQEILRQEAGKQKIEVSPKEIDSVYQGFAKSFPDSASFAQAMQKAGDSPEKLRAKISEQVRAEKLILKAVGDSLKVTDAEIKDFYEQNKAMMSQAAQLKARHILKLVKDPKDSAKVKAEMEAIAKKLQDPKADFAAIAKAESQDPGSAEKGGDLGWFNPADMVPQFAMAAQSLKEGETSGLVRTPYGYHIIKLEGRREGKTPPLDSVRTQIEAQLKYQKQGTVSENYFRRLLKSYPVVFVDQTYRSKDAFEDAPKAEKKPAVPGTPGIPAPVPGK